MNTDNITDVLHQGFRVTLGATSSVIEMLQDSQKRNENLEKIQSQWSQLAHEWAEKGEQTEQEARKFVDNIIEQRASSTTTGTSSNSSSSVTTTPVPTTDVDSAQEIQELTNQIAALRQELEGLQGSDSPN